MSDVTGQVTWASSDPDIVEMKAGGVAFGKGRGPAVVSARLSPTAPSQSVRVMVTEAGTFEIAGRVTEAGSGDAVFRATVEVEAGVGTGLRSTTDAMGRYVLYGVAGSVRVRASSDGHSSRSEEVSVSGRTIRDIALAPLAPNANLTGAWSLTISAPASCQILPAEAHTRQFIASISPTDSRLIVGLSSSSLVRAEFVSGQARGNAITMTFPYWPGDSGEPEVYYYVLDALPSGGFLGIQGTLLASGDEQRLDGVLEGGFAFYRGAVSAGVPQTCTGLATVSLRRTGVVLEPRPVYE